MTRELCFIEGSVGPTTYSIVLRSLVLPSLDFKGRIIEIGEIPLRDGVIIDEMNLN